MRNYLKPHMRRLMSIGLAGATVFGMGSIAYAAPKPATPQIRIWFGRSDRDRGITREQLRAFNRFLDDHPYLDRRLRRDPVLVNDPDFQADHPELRAWLDDHPYARRALRADPDAFMDVDRY